MSEKFTKFFIPISIIVAGLLIAGAFTYVNWEKLQTFLGAKENLTAQEVADKAINFINENKDSIAGGLTASLISVSEAGSVYKIHIKVGEGEYDSYATKDGTFLFPEGYSLTATSSQGSNTSDNNQAPKTTCEDLKKSEKPILEAFVVSNCPYGLQMQRILYETLKNIPSLEENIKVEYIGAIEGNKITSMHGDNEAQENLRQICIREEQPDKYWDYIGCYIQKGDTDGCLTSANVDKTKLNACMTDAAKGLKYAKADFDAQARYGVSGSPTLFLNGEKVSEFDFGGRTAEALKTLLCCGFSTQPGSCSQKLTEDSAATGFSESYASSGGSSNSGGGCEQ